MNNEPEKKNETEPRRHLTSAERQALYAEHAKNKQHTARKKQKDKKLRLMLIAVSVLLVLVVGLIAFLIVNKTVIQPQKAYERAEALCAGNSYLKAYQVFLGLGSYRDAAARAADCLVKNAQLLSGRDNVIMGTSASQPWFSFDSEGGLRFDAKKYKGGPELVIPDVFDDVLVTRIAPKGFFYAENLTSIAIPASVTLIGERAFFSCTGLTGIVLSDNVETLGESAFAGCSSAATLSIGKGLTEIGQRAFKDCSSLVTVVIPDGVTVIGSRAFNGCTALEEITLPASLTEVGGYAFTDCKALKTVRFAGTRAALAAACTAEDGSLITACPGLVCAD